MQKKVHIKNPLMSLEVGITNRPKDSMRNVISSLASTVFPTFILSLSSFLPGLGVIHSTSRLHDLPFPNLPLPCHRG